MEQSTNDNFFEDLGKGKRPYDLQDGPSKRKTLLELCEREEWNIIIESLQDLIHVWDFDERNADNNTPIHICCEKGALNVLQHLLKPKKFNIKEHKGKHGNSCVLLAAQNGHLETLKWLIENGCSINDRNDDNESCLMLASMEGHLETVKWLIENGSSINERDDNEYSCLLRASMGGHLEIVKWLIENGCSIHDRDIFGHSCLYHALSEDGNCETANWLIENGCSIQNSDLLMGAANGYLETLKLLFKKGYSIKKRNNHGDSCLLRSSMNGELETVKWLVENGCPMKERDDEGNSCLLLASISGDLETVKWLV